MELRKSFDVRKVWWTFYAVCFGVFLAVGLTSAEAVTKYEISGQLTIPAVGLSSEVTTLSLNDNKLDTPDYIVGSFSNHKNKVLLIGHASTVFRELNRLVLGDTIIYDGTEYTVTSMKYAKKDKIKMSEVLKAEEEKTLVLMTCAGRDLDDGDATHRLILTAKA